MKSLALLGLCFYFSSCAYSVHKHHVSDYELGEKSDLSKGLKVQAEGNQFVFLGITGQTDYADTAWTMLQDKCPQGKILGINTRHSTDLGFFSWTNRVLMSGICLKF
jgi:hypothetical protein